MLRRKYPNFRVGEIWSKVASFLNLHRQTNWYAVSTKTLAVNMTQTGSNLIIIKVFFAQLRFSFIQAIHFSFFAVSLLQKFEYHFFISMSFVNDQS